MKILHTSDLHLGKRLHQHSLLPDQKHVLEQMVQHIVEQDPDLFIVAGDVFDRSLPPEDAMALFGWWLSAIRDRKPTLPIVIIAGNHDSGKRIAWASQLLLHGHIYLRGIPKTVEEPIHFETSKGELVEVWALPFAWAGDLEQPEGETHTQVGAFSAAIDIIRAKQDPGRKQILVAHCFAQGGSESESERQLLGQATLIDNQLFAGFDYVALGHLHKSQKVSKNSWYSGSPLAYSFSENSHEKGMLLARIGDSLEVETLPLQPLHHMQIVNDTVESLLESDKHDAHRDCYLSVRLTENSPLNDPINHIRARFPYILNLRVKMEEMSELSVAVGDRTGATDLQDDLSNFWIHLTGDPPSGEVLSVFQDLRPDQGGEQ